MTEHACDAAFFIAHASLALSGAQLALDFAEGERAAALALARRDAAVLPASLDRLLSRDPAVGSGCCAFRRIPGGDGAPPLSLTLHFRAGAQRLSLAVAVATSLGHPRGLLTLSPVGHALSVQQPCPQVDLFAAPDAVLPGAVGVHYLHARVLAAEAGPATVVLYAAGLAGAAPTWIAGSVWG